MTIQIAKPASINKIVVVGHPLSGYKDVENLLSRNGMSTAQASRRDGLLPAEISLTLSKAHQIPLIDAFEPLGDIAQASANPMWHGLAMDLLMGNIDQKLWGWADPQAVYWLDYWKDLDPSLAFVLVYDTPQQLVMQAFDSKISLSPETLEQVTNNWLAYNEALLHFYYSNPARCLLVNGQQVGASSALYLQQVRLRIGAPVQVDACDVDNDELVAITSTATASNVQDSYKNYLAQGLIQSHPDLMALYEELQRAANLPLNDTVFVPTALDAWVALTDVEARNADLLDAAKAAVATATGKLQKQEERVAALQDAEARYVDLQKITKATSTDAAAKLQEQEKIIAALQDSERKLALAGQSQQQENDLILQQLHRAQEELERNYQKIQEYKQKTDLKPAPHYGAAERVKQELPYRLGATMIAQSRSVIGWLGMIGALSKQKQQFKHEQKTRGMAELPPICDYADASDGDRVKQHLSYRLGSAMIANSGSLGGWIRMPWILRCEVSKFKKNKK